MKIVHASDWHGRWKKLPYADLYIFTGDMLPEYGRIQDPPNSFTNKRGQRKWCIDNLSNARERWLENPDAKIAVVRGNHDFIDIGEYFMGYDEFAFEVNEATNLYGFCPRNGNLGALKIGGTRGMPLAFDHYWNDEMDDDEFEIACNSLPNDLDILITHCPPEGILDVGGHPPRHLGSKHIAQYVVKNENLKLHCFGHIHEDGGTVRVVGKTIFSNAACTFNEIELE